MLDRLPPFIDRLTGLQLLLLFLVVAGLVLVRGWFRFAAHLLSTPNPRHHQFPRFRSLYNPVGAAYFRAGRYHQRLSNWIRNRSWSDSDWLEAVQLLYSLTRLESRLVRWWGWVNWQDIHLLLLLFGGVYTLLFLPLLLLTYYDTVSQLNWFADRSPSHQLVGYDRFFLRRYIHRFSGPTPFFGWAGPDLEYDRHHPTNYYYSERTPAYFRSHRTPTAILGYKYQTEGVQREPKLGYLFLVGYLGILPLQLYILHQAAKLYTFGIYDVDYTNRWVQTILERQSQLMFGVVRLNRVMGLWLLFHLPLVFHLLWGPIDLFYPWPLPRW